MTLQRFFDILFSCSALLVLSPLLLPISIILKCSGEGEIFFLQDRVGKNGKIFKLFKFATMLKDSPNLGTGTVTVKCDTRVLPVGKCLRKTKLNELPQLLNILYGDMSLIGPRPLTEETFGSYSTATQNIIRLVKPGLSGVGSIIFCREEDIMHGTRASVDFYKNVISPYKGELEKWYVLNISLYTYFIAIFVTVWVVLFPKSTIAWKVFKGLPEPSEELKLAIDNTYGL